MSKPSNDALFALARTLTCLCGARLDVLRAHLLDTKDFTGEVWECGAYRGGSALYIATQLREMGSARRVRVFDTFAGMPVSGPLDTHKIGSFIEADYEEVCQNLSSFSNVTIHRGVMPETFVGLEDSTISIAHIDADQHESVHACLTFIYPRLQIGGYMIVDDYNCIGCPGAKKAVDDFMIAHPAALTLIPTDSTPQVRLLKHS